MLKYRYFSFLFFLNWCYAIYGQTLQQTLNFGDALFQSGKVIPAINEFQRAYFFGNEQIKCTTANKIAFCYLSQSNTNKAKSWFDSAKVYTVTDNNYLSTCFNIVHCYLLEKNYLYAYNLLDRINADTSSYYYRKKFFYMGLCDLGLNNFKTAEQHFFKAIDLTDSVMQSQYKLLQSNSKKLKRPNPKLAMILSGVVPGSGQVYSGAYLDGLNSIGLLSGIVYLGLNFLYAEASIMAPFFYRYYIGGIINAKEWANIKRAYKKQTYYSNMIVLGLPQRDTIESIFPIYFGDRHRQHHVSDSYKRNISRDPIVLSALFMAYKNFFSSQDANTCVFHPSCSVYMMDALEEKGRFIGFLDGFDRLLRCHPFVNEADYNLNPITENYEDPLQ